MLLISRSLLLGRGEWSPQLRQSQRSKGTRIAFHGSGDGGLLFAISEVLRGRRISLETARETRVLIRPVDELFVSQRLSGKLFVGWMQPTNSPEKAVGFTHRTIVTQAFPDSLSEN